MHRLITNKGSSLLGLKPKGFLTSIIARSFNSNKYLDEGEYIEGELPANPENFTKSDTTAASFSRKFMSLEELKKIFQHPKHSAPKTEEGLSQSLQSVQEKFKFKLAVQEEPQQPQYPTTEAN